VVDLTADPDQRRRGLDLVVLDYGSGNLRSAERALARVAGDEGSVEITADLRRAAEADGLVVPGVGAFAACMAGIETVGARSVIAERVGAGRPVLGICVGHQVLFEAGEEHGVTTKGLGLIGGTVRLLAAERVPHMGWNTVAAPVGSMLFRDIEPEARFYFVHSYAASVDATAASGFRAATTTHGEPFVAAVESADGVLAGTQFHPEKSGDVGATLLRNWVDEVRRRAADVAER
jgi:imidazole glycerol-phosphate synthase subunit HisH